jgi:HEAT repeat protein
MSYEPSPAELSREIEENVVHWRPVTNLNRYPAQRAERAGYAFCYLGTVARATIPELTRLARTASNLKGADRFTDALVSIGPEAVSNLVSLATNGPPWTRWAAIDALGTFAHDPAVAAPLVPLLMNCLSENDTNTGYPVTGRAEGVLTAMTPEIVTTALTNALQSASAYTRQRAIVCLMVFEIDNPTNVPHSAVPALRAAMRDPDSGVRSIATNILRRMGGWEAPGANPDR